MMHTFDSVMILIPRECAQKLWGPTGSPTPVVVKSIFLRVCAPTRAAFAARLRTTHLPTQIQHSSKDFHHLEKVHKNQKFSNWTLRSNFLHTTRVLDRYDRNGLYLCSNTLFDIFFGFFNISLKNEKFQTKKIIFHEKYVFCLKVRKLSFPTVPWSSETVS